VGAVLIGLDDGWTLLDTGMNTAIVRDGPLRERFFGPDHAVEPVLPDGDGEPLLDALAAHGVAPGDVRRIVLSHLHYDHAGGLRLFPGVPVFIQYAELEWGLSGHPGPERAGAFRLDYDDPAIDWRLLDGDATIAPGLEVLSTPGHTPGHQSVLAGGVLFGCDVADLQENIDREIGPGGFVGDDPEPARRSMLRAKAVAVERGVPLVPWHCPVTWPAFCRAAVDRDAARP
jgi:glyoxylase-like metal-dependent hydrolase (beta-lactamase superfamily II)